MVAAEAQERNLFGAQLRAFLGACPNKVVLVLFGVS
jgi:hypothetical protein